jgi:hypothetical protein
MNVRADGMGSNEALLPPLQVFPRFKDAGDLALYFHTAFRALLPQRRYVKVRGENLEEYISNKAKKARNAAGACHWRILFLYERRRERLTFLSIGNMPVSSGATWRLSGATVGAHQYR